MSEFAVTMTGLILVWKIMLLSGLIGFWVTGGVWCFCKWTKWAPVNIVVNNYRSNDQ